MLHCLIENFFPVIFITFQRSVSYLEFSRLVYGMSGNKRIPLPACVSVEIKKEFPVEKHESYAGFDLNRIQRRLARVCLIFTLFILTNCYYCSKTVKYWKKYLKKPFQSCSFGDQQLTEPLLHRHIHSLIYFNNTFNYSNGLSHRVDKQRL